MLLFLILIDKLTKEEEEIYKLQHDLERTVISQQQSKKISEVRGQFFLNIYKRVGDDDDNDNTAILFIS